MFEFTLNPTKLHLFYTIEYLTVYLQGLENRYSTIDGQIDQKSVKSERIKLPHMIGQNISSLIIHDWSKSFFLKL